MNADETETVLVTEIEEATLSDLETTDFVVVVSRDGKTIKRVNLVLLAEYLGTV